MEIAGSLFLSLNFESDALPKTIELVPAGAVVHGRDGRRWKNGDPRRVALNSMARQPRLVIDENHSTDLSAPKGGASPAMGWMTKLRAEADGSIRADVEWTKRGAKAVLNREYSYISPVFLHDDGGEVTAVLRAALTNSPNLRLPALNSESQFFDNNANDDTEEPMKKALCAVLGLPETATEDDILAALKALQGKALNAEAQGTTRTPAVDLAVYAPRADLNAMEARAAAAEKRIAELDAARLKDEAEATVDGAIRARKIAPASRDEYLALCSTEEGVEKLKGVFAKTPEIIGAEPQAPEGAPPPGETAALNAEEASLAKAMGYTAEEYGDIKGGKK